MSSSGGLRAEATGGALVGKPGCRTRVFTDGGPGTAQEQAAG